MQKTVEHTGVKQPLFYFQKVLFFKPTLERSGLQMGTRMNYIITTMQRAIRSYTSRASNSMGTAESALLTGQPSLAALASSRN